jgi:hypothetical protein
MTKGPSPKAVNVTPPLLCLAEDPIWRAEFRGLFLGEGWLGIIRFRGRRNGKSASNWTYRPEMNITQNWENRNLVDHIRDVLGGFVYERSPYVHGSDKVRRGPYFTWMSRSNPISRRAWACLAEGHFTPLDKKADAIAAFGCFLDLLDTWGGLTKPPEVLEQIEALRIRVHPNS